MAVCYRGFFKSHLKAIVFSQDNELLAVSSDTGTIHVFHIGAALRARNNLKHVRKNELRFCVHIKLDNLMKNDCQSFFDKQTLK